MSSSQYKRRRFTVPVPPPSQYCRDQPAPPQDQSREAPLHSLENSSSQIQQKRHSEGGAGVRFHPETVIHYSPRVSQSSHLVCMSMKQMPVGLNITTSTFPHARRTHETHTKLSTLSSASLLPPSSHSQIPPANLRKYSVFNPHIPLELQNNSPNTSAEHHVIGWLLLLLSYCLIVLTLPLSLFFCIKVDVEYERSIIFRLGRIQSGGAKGPGLFFIIPCVDRVRRVDLRTVTFDVPPQEVLTKDSVTVAVDAVVYYRIYNPLVAITNVEDADRSTRLLAATTLRNVLGTKNLAEILSERESISSMMQTMLDDATDPWGVKVERVEVKDVRLPVQLQRAMAAEAEATREAKAKVIAAEGEQKSSRALKVAADVIGQSPFALQLRYLQTLNTISAEKNSTIIFPFPLNIFSTFNNVKIDDCEKQDSEII